MRRWETLTALLAVVLASLSALAVRGRLLFALAAVVLLLLVIASRLRAAILNRRKARTPAFDPYERARQIQEARDRRFR